MGICCISAYDRASLGDRLEYIFSFHGEPWTLASRLPFPLGCSGGHFNPAVSLAVTLIGGLNIMLLIPYWISQLFGGLIGAALAKVSDPCWDWGWWLVSDGISFPFPLFP